MDLVAEVVDARIPISSRNRISDDHGGGANPAWSILNRADQADPAIEPRLWTSLVSADKRLGGAGDRRQRPAKASASSAAERPAGA
ncbi:MAG: hypothetical protein ACLRWQ_12885 [Flavonifractor plautii]